MKFSVSNLSFTGGKIKWMQDMPSELGIEVFYEWGSRDYWNNILPCLLEGRSGGFSIHGPMMFDDVSIPCDERILFEHMKAPFDIYHKFHAEFYVVHTNAGMRYEANPIIEEENRKRALERINRFNDICMREGVRLAVENIGWNAEKRFLFNHTQFLNLFRQVPEISCLIDIGHTLLSDLSITELQKELKDRIIAYHIHDNDGLKDLHLPVGEGSFDWKGFMDNVQKHTPDAILVLEYADVANPKRYCEDSIYLRNLCAEL